MPKRPKEIPSKEINLRLEILKFRSLAHFLMTGLPTLPIVLDEIQETMSRHGSVGMICLELSKNEKLERIYGWQIYDEILISTTTLLKNFIGKHLRKEDIAAISHEHDDVFLIFLSAKRTGGRQTMKNLEVVGQRLRKFLAHEINRIHEERLKFPLDFQTGYALINHNPDVRLERTLYRKINEAISLSRNQRTVELNRKIADLSVIIKNQSIIPEFQPIVNLDDRSIFAYEALARGPRGTVFENPVVLFGTAEIGDLVPELDRACLHRAVSQASELVQEHKLFLNLHPATVVDPRFHNTIDFSSFLENTGNIVLEITEGNGIADYKEFSDKLELCRKQGLKIAVDDTGAGYGSLRLVTTLRPDYMKIDIRLVKDIDCDPVRQNLVKMLVDFSRMCEAVLIAEGVETEEELEALKALGVRYAQGFILAYPEEISPAAVA